MDENTRLLGLILNELKQSNRLLGLILNELKLMRKEQTSLIRLWMKQDRHYHKKTLKGLEK